MVVCFSFTGIAQNFSGQWKGSFNETRDPSRTDYVLEIEAKGNKFEGVSITYFNINGKRCYTMCAIKGTIDPGSKTLTSTEISKIKANTPDWFRDCFQTHILTFYKKGEEEQLVGSWKSARKEDNCGTGSTTLSRKILTTASKNKPTIEQKTPADKTKIQEKITPPTTQNPTNNDLPKPVVKENPDVETERLPVLEPEKKSPPTPLPVLEKRNNNLKDTVVVESSSFEVALYDNAEIDGDIITLLFNDEIILHKRLLTDKAIRVALKIVPGKSNTLIMYAENQGRVPPNTALIEIKDQRNNTHRIFLKSDDTQNGGVFVKLKE